MSDEQHTDEQQPTGDPGQCRHCGQRLVWQPGEGIYSVPGGSPAGGDCAKAPTRNHRPQKGAGLDTSTPVTVVAVTGPEPDSCMAVRVPATDYTELLAELMALYDAVEDERVEWGQVHYRNLLGEWHTVTIRWETVVVDMRDETRGAVVVMRDPAFR